MTASATLNGTTTSKMVTERLLATFWLDDLLLGIDIGIIREINRLVDITPVPDTPHVVRGVVNLRGDVVTVLDLRSILDLPGMAITSQSRLIILDSGEERIGLLVDRVSDVVSVSSDLEEPLPANVGGIDSRYFQSVYKLETELLVVLDVEAALQPQGQGP